MRNGAVVSVSTKSNFLRLGLCDFIDLCKFIYAFCII